ncbi:MAG: imidazole glycerol phosphate synthase subunit HisH [Erythrobacter sp.]
MASSTILIDYGAGNLHSVHNALKAAGASVHITADPDPVRTADRIVLPGVGSYKSCADGLRALTGMVEALEERVRVDAVPFLGICVGMQLLADRGLEHGETLGLGWIGGDVRLIEPSDPAIKVPHMGWNDVALLPHVGTHPLIEQGEAYFLHSYHFAAHDPQNVCAMTDHGQGLVAAVASETVVGVQFHPEKSQAYGLEMLANFLEWKP